MQSSISEVIRNRRTIHSFQQQLLPPRKQILAALEHAICAPNHYNTEPWRFYLIGEETVEKICRLNAEQIRLERGDKAADLKYQRWREIPGWLLITCIKSDEAIKLQEDYAACCCAAQNFMLYLWSLDIGVKWTTGSVTRDDRFYEIVGIEPAEETLVGMFWYGYPDEVPHTAPKSLEQKVFELP